ncbi:MAG: hypothetical protein ACOCQY_03065 [Halorhabdus sp.]
MTLAVGYLRFSQLLPDVAVARRTLQSYWPYVPWMLRLSVGLPLVGAGFAGYLFTPGLPVEARILQVSMGFLLLFGLATRLVAIVGLLPYLSPLDGPDVAAGQRIRRWLPGHPDRRPRSAECGHAARAPRRDRRHHRQSSPPVGQPAAVLERLGIDNF